MEKRIGSNLKRLIRKYEYLLEDWEEVEEISNAANQGMSAELHKHSPPNIKPSDFEVEESEDDIQDVEKITDDSLKKLFRRIVVQCHPDRLPSDISESQRLERLDLYDKAIRAQDSSNWAMMVIIAIKLGIELPEEAEERVEQIEEETKRLEEKIVEVTNSIQWQWYHSSSTEKEQIVNRYLEILQKKKVQFEELKNRENPEKKGSKLILGLGHPRTGTGYTSKLLQSWGLDVGHEKMGEDGTVDWTLAAAQKSMWQDVVFNEWDWQHIIYCVRDPRESITSIAFTENSRGSVDFRTRLERNVANENKISSAIASIIKWDQLITSLNPSFIYRIEDESEKLFKYLQSKGVDVIWGESMIGRKYNQREHRSWEELLSESGYVANRFKNQINDYCDRYGYKRLF